MSAKTIIVLAIICFIPSIILAQPKEVIDAYNLENAIKSGDMDKVKQLIQSGVDVNVQYNGRNALQAACDNKSIEMVKIIIDAGGDVNSKDNDGNGITTLQRAIGGCSSQIIQLLLSKGADPNMPGQNNALAINYAIAHSRDKQESLKILELLFEYKADINAGGEFQAPVITAVIHQRSDMLAVLLKEGVDPNIAGKESKSPLHFAVENRDIESVKLLVANGAEVDVKNSEGQTPLEYASAKAEKKYLDPNSKKKYQEIVNILTK